MKGALCGFFCFTCLLAWLPSQADDRIPVAVVALRADVRMEEGTERTLDEFVLNEFHRFKQFRILGSSDIKAMLKHEEQKAILLGCTEDSCLAEIGGALGVDMVAVPSLGAVGSNYVVSLKLLDVRKASVVERVSETVPRDDDELLSALKRAVAAVLRTALRLKKGSLSGTKTAAHVVPDPLTEPVQTQTSSATRVEARAESPTSATDVAPWLSLGLTAAAAVGGGVLAGIASSEADAATKEYEGTAAWQSHKDEAESMAMGADILFITAGAGAVTTVLLFLFLDGDDQVSIAVSPAKDGAMAACFVRF